MATLAIDIETYSGNDIRYGVYKYADAADFEILLIGYAFDDGPVQVADLTREEVPARFVQALFDRSVTKTAFNANFEMTCLSKYYPDMPRECWECTSILALYNSLPTGLANVARILRLGADKQKDARGKALINYFSRPCKPTKANGGRTRNRPEDAPEKWAEYIEYNRQDVVVERAIRQKLLRLSPTEAEHRYWLMDQQINANGAKIDRQLVAHAIRMSGDYSRHLKAEAGTLTGLANPNSVAQLKDWIKGRTGSAPDSLDKKAVAELLSGGGLPSDVRRVLEIRSLLGRTSIKKYEAMEQAVCADGRVRGMFQFYGAMRTGRWAGRIVQLHNLPRSSMPVEELRAARSAVLRGDLEELELLWDNVPDVLSQLVRTAIVAEPGCRFVVDDYSAIEARVIAWLAGEKWRQEVFARDGDIYCASASAMFGIPVVKHGVNGHLRQKGKIAELALGYGGSVGALKAMGADKMGLTDEELSEIVTKWRKASPAIIRFWGDVDRAARKAISNPGEAARIRQGGICFHCRAGALFIELPSGRHLVYIHPRLGQNRFGGESILYEGTVQGTGQWGELETYGGKLVENIVQATARDCLAAAMLRLTKAGYKILMHVHDEVVMEVPEDTGSLEDVTKIMAMNEPWEKGLIKNADGFEDVYYRKD